MKEYGLPDRTVRHQITALLARAAEAVVVPHGDAGSVFFRGIQDEVHFLQAAGQRLFTQDAGNAGFRRGNGDLGVGIHPGADTDDIGTLLVEHIQVAGIPASDAGFIRSAVRGLPADIRDAGRVHVVMGLPCADVSAGNAPRADHTGTKRCHSVPFSVSYLILFMWPPIRLTGRLRRCYHTTESDF